MTTTTTTSSCLRADPLRVPTTCAVVALRGPDARRFCNSVFSNNARDLKVGSGQCTAMLDDRGRIQGLMRLYCLDGSHFVAVLDGMSLEVFQERYRMYVVLDDVEIDASDWGVIQGMGPVPQMEGPGCALRLGGTRWEVIGPRAALQKVEASIPKASRQQWTLTRVQEVLPEFPLDFLDDKRLPHEMNLRPEYLSFEKGCYIGQETVNRVDVMGQVKRHLVCVSMDAPLEPGADLLHGERRVGRVTSVVEAEEGSWFGLAVLRAPLHEPGTHLSTGDGSAEVQAPTWVG